MTIITEEMQLLRHFSRKLVRELGLIEPVNRKMHSYWHALIEIDNKPGIALAPLSHLLVLHLSKTSRIVKSLLSDGLIEARTGSDSREKTLYITQKGSAKIEYIDRFSLEKIARANSVLSDEKMMQITQAIESYANALEETRLFQEQKIKIMKLSLKRALIEQTINMIETIQYDEFDIKAPGLNDCIRQLNKNYYYNNTCNFWYALDSKGQIVGSIGLKKINEHEGQIKKCFVMKEYRGKGLAKRLMDTAKNAAKEHGFEKLYLSTIDILVAANNFYMKTGFEKVALEQMPGEFDPCSVDNVFFVCKL